MSKPLVLLTGASGFVAHHVLDQLITHGFSVRATVRSLSRSQDLIKSHENNKVVEFIEVPDLLEGDLTSVIRGVGAIVHTASPYHFQVKDPKKDMLDPAIKATLNVLRYAKKESVKRVVITSSFAAVSNLNLGGPWRNYTYVPDDWNPVTFEEADDIAQAPGYIYAASKKLAEKAAWEYCNAEGLDLTTINPPMIYGPPLQAVSDPSKLNTSSALIWDLISGKTESVPDTRLPLFADVRDVALAHVRSLEVEESKGKRMLICGGSFTWYQAVEYLSRERPSLLSHLPSLPSTPPEPKPIAKLDTTYARDILGIQFIGWEKSLTDSVDDLVKRAEEGGWWKKD